MPRWDSKAFRKNLITELQPLLRGQQGLYKACLARTMATTLEPPAAGSESALFANRLRGTDCGPWIIKPSESLVDLAFLERAAKAAAWTTVATAESEAYARHAVDLPQEDDEFDVGYFWDLYKLLQVYSPVRVFQAVTTQGNGAKLMANLVAYVQRYGAHLSHPVEVELAVVEDVNATSGWVRFVAITGSGGANLVVGQEEVLPP